MHLLIWLPNSPQSSSFSKVHHQHKQPGVRCTRSSTRSNDRCNLCKFPLFNMNFLWTFFVWVLEFSNWTSGGVLEIESAGVRFCWSSLLLKFSLLLKLWTSFEHFDVQSSEHLESRLSARSSHHKSPPSRIWNFFICIFKHRRRFAELDSGNFIRATYDLVQIAHNVLHRDAGLACRLA